MANGKFQRWLRPDGLAQVEGWAHDGLTDEQIAHNMGISTTTLYVWEKRFPAFLQALKKAKAVADYMVENALFKRATGYTTIEHQYKMVDLKPEILAARRRAAEDAYRVDHPDANDQNVQDFALKTVPTRERIELSQGEKEVPPNTTAAIFWLKNRRPTDWRDRQELTHSGDLQVSALDKMTTAELERHLTNLEGDDDGQSR